jgi:CxxC motif-containing protein (DUF1111 family)
VAFSPFSDFAVHSMGVGLADNITPQGNATGCQFRSAPLWGVGQRIFFLHDGRTNALAASAERCADRGAHSHRRNHFTLMRHRSVGRAARFLARNGRSKKLSDS